MSEEVGVLYNVSKRVDLETGLFERAKEGPRKQG